jgi:transposase-like protein
MRQKIGELLEIVRDMTEDHIEQIIIFASQVVDKIEIDRNTGNQNHNATQHEMAERQAEKVVGETRGTPGTDSFTYAISKTPEKDRAASESCGLPGKAKPIGGTSKTLGHGHRLMPCPHCGSSNVTLFGSKHGKQRFRCKDCGKTYVTTTGTIMSHSHLSEEDWRQAVRDTVEGRTLRATEQELGMSHDTAFGMRHKILTALEQNEAVHSTVLGGECELDETYVLEDLKGKKIPDTYWRRPRKHGARALSRGISSEYVCIMTGIERGGEAYAVSINVATPSKDEIKTAFHEHIAEGAHIFCDGAKGYNTLYDDRKCEVTHTHAREINTANGFHSFIKNIHNCIYHGVATKYLNRYNALFAAVYRHWDSAFKKICALLGIRFNADLPTRAELSNNNILNILVSYC